MSLAIAKEFKVVEAFMHDEMSRVTLLFHNFGAFTFSLKKKKELTDRAKWHAEFPLEEDEYVPLEERTEKLVKSDTRSVDCKIKFIINETNNKEGREPGFEIKGSGEDDGSKFKIKSDYVLTNNNFFKDWNECEFMMDGED